MTERQIAEKRARAQAEKLNDKNMYSSPQQQNQGGVDPRRQYALDLGELFCFTQSSVSTSNHLPLSFFFDSTLTERQIAEKVCRIL